MEKEPWIRFGRRRGIVWVCDVAKSASAINDEELVDYIEEYLPRLYWIGEQIVESAGGEFIKWTGDGFLAWFDCEVERNMGKEAAAVFDAAWHLSFSNAITNLAVESPKPFHIRHGVSWEPDALFMHTTHTKKSKTKDILGQKVVLAFRCSGIPVDFPRIVTLGKLSKVARKTQGINQVFIRLQLNDDDALRYFKGERKDLRSLVGSSKARKNEISTSPLAKQIELSVNTEISKKSLDSRYLFTIKKYLEHLQNGPEWAQMLLEQEKNFAQNKIHGVLKPIFNDIYR